MRMGQNQTISVNSQENMTRDRMSVISSDIVEPSEQGVDALQIQDQIDPEDGLPSYIEACSIDINQESN